MERDRKDVKSALLVMDIQDATIGRIGDSNDILRSLATAIGAARQAGIPVIYVVLGFRKGFPEVSPDNKAFSAIKAGAYPLRGLEDPVVHVAIAPLPEEVVVIKRRVSAFTGSDLEVMLRAGGIRHLVLTGLATSGVVLSTLREAADKDYYLTVLSDGCADMDEEVHRVLMTKVFPRQAGVMTAEQWVAGLGKPEHGVAGLGKSEHGVAGLDKAEQGDGRVG